MKPPVPHLRLCPPVTTPTRTPPDLAIPPPLLPSQLTKEAVDLLAHVIRREDLEESRTTTWHKFLLSHNTPTDFTAPETALRDEAGKERVSRSIIEHDFYTIVAHGYGPAYRPPPSTPGLSADERFAAFEVRRGIATKAWQEWRNNASDMEVYAARIGQGPGAQLCQTFRQARAWAQEAGILLEAERDRNHRLSLTH